MGSRRKKY